MCVSRHDKTKVRTGKENRRTAWKNKREACLQETRTTVSVLHSFAERGRWTKFHRHHLRDKACRLLQTPSTLPLRAKKAKCERRPIFLLDFWRRLSLILSLARGLSFNAKCTRTVVAFALSHTNDWLQQYGEGCAGRLAQVSRVIRGS